jgi:hypothetical protein
LNGTVASFPRIGFAFEFLTSTNLICFGKINVISKVVIVPYIMEGAAAKHS